MSKACVAAGSSAMWMGVLGASLMLAACKPAGEAKSAKDAAPASAAHQRLVDAASEPQNWLSHGGTYAEQRYSALDAINRQNVSSLSLAWSLELDTNRGQETTPLAVDGKVYVTTAWSKVVAMDAATGAQLWQYDPKVPPQTAVRGCCDVINRGAAYYDGKIYAGTFDGRLFALDAATGKELWIVDTTLPGKPYSITGAPRVVKGRVIIGNAGADLGVRGYVTAYDAQTGKKAWRFFTVPNAEGKPDGEVSDSVLQAKAQSTWSDGAWKQTGGGGTVWDAIVYDAELDQLYLGVGNGAPWSHLLRSGGQGDNLFLSSIVALDPDTGAYKWHYQETPGESWDFTATQPITLATLTIDGQPRKVLMQAPKNGFFYVVDRSTGKPISAQKFVNVSWATGIDLASGRPQEVEGARYQKAPFLMAPSAYGGHNWYPMSFSPRTGLVYLPIQEIPAFYEQDAAFQYRPQTFNLGSYSAKNAIPDDKAKLAAIRAALQGALIAWDPVAQREVWRAPQPGPATAGTLATAGDLVFEGTPAGLFEAFDAKSGARLWKFQAQTAIVGSPISYRVNGEQYVLVVSGAGGGYGLTSPFNDDTRKKPNGRVLAFKLGGKAALPAFEAPDLAPVVTPADRFTDAQRARGERVFETTCGWCHGAAAMSGGVLPDLRRSPMLLSQQGWRAVVIDGALQQRGMVSFVQTLTPEDAEAVRAYVAARAIALKQQSTAP
ncbi:PQQ-dependent dehydrogenase, methanol/ethanol family [Hydrocarboniphaga effusa]|uniref:PQQ-dependent dehydrogenase, methanol/ethanol family n=1 Tax=Hydrocarboniphaga effusa TaxID=243629 RepID=UPI003BAA21AA